MQSTSVNSIVLVLIGPVVSFLTTYFNHKFTEKRDSEKYKIDQFSQSKKFEFDKELFYKNDLNNSIEIICKTLFLFKHYVSITSSVISHEFEMIEFDRDYRKESEQLAHLKSLIFIKLPQYSYNANKIAGHHNNYWGNQRILLRVDINNDAGTYRSLQSKVIEISNEINNEIDKLIAEIQLFYTKVNK